MNKDILVQPKIDLDFLCLLYYLEKGSWVNAEVR